jgi:ubiquinol-cytochrome c reductase cytochrome c1 subunit
VNLKQYLTALSLLLTNLLPTKFYMNHTSIIMLLNKSLARLVAALGIAVVVSPVLASESSYPLDPFPMGKLTDQAALQDGARTFVNNCLNCHGATAMRYNRLRDIGLSEDQIRDNLMFATDKVGETMKTALSVKDAKEWFGAVPPDLSVVARSRASSAGSGPDWLYTYLRAYYRDSTRATGWNNALYENVGMPHILWENQGAKRGATIEEVRAVKDAAGLPAGYSKITVSFDKSGTRTEKTDKLEGTGHHASKTIKLDTAEGGSMDKAKYDESIANLVAYLTYMGDPTAKQRQSMGVWVIMFLCFFTLFAWYLNRLYWKDIK